jgi:hypothetical protein
MAPNKPYSRYKDDINSKLINYDDKFVKWIYLPRDC